MYAVRTQLTWTHLRSLMSIEDEVKRRFYMAKPSMQSLKQNRLFFDAGYYDQSHFIKDFKDFYGITLGKAFEDYDEKLPE